MLPTGFERTKRFQTTYEELKHESAEKFFYRFRFQTTYEELKHPLHRDFPPSIKSLPDYL